MDESITGILNNWYYDKTYNIIWGDVEGDVHGRWVDGTKIHTSNLTTKGSTAKDGDVVTTRNSRYKLGKALKINANL